MYKSSRKYTRGKTLGHCSFGSVYQCTDNMTRERCVMKLVDLKGLTGKDLKKRVEFLSATLTVHVT